MQTAFILTAYGCAQKKVEVSLASNATPTDIIQIVNNGELESINPTADISSTPVVTPDDASLTTLEATEEPIQSNYFLFSPTVEEEKELEVIAEEYIKRLDSNKCNEFPYGYGNLPPLSIVKILCGNFDNIGKPGPLMSKEDCLFHIHNFINHYLVAVGYGIEEICNNNPDGVYFKNLETYKIFEIGGFDNYPGVDTLKLVENKVTNINNSIKNKDNDSLTKYAVDLLTITEMIFINDGGSYNGIKITAFKNMYPTIKLFVKDEIETTLGGIYVASQDATIKANDSSKYNLYQLLYVEIFCDDAINDLIDNEILALMDAYAESFINEEK